MTIKEYLDTYNYDDLPRNKATEAAHYTWSVFNLISPVGQKLAIDLFSRCVLYFGEDLVMRHKEQALAYCAIKVLADEVTIPSLRIRQKLEPLDITTTLKKSSKPIGILMKEVDFNKLWE